MEGLLLLVMCLIKWSIMNEIVKMADKLRPLIIRYYAFKMLLSIPISFAINFGISTLFMSFTGGGLTAGFANLGADVVIGILFPVYFRRKYDLEAMKAEAKFTNPFKKNKKKSKIIIKET